MKKEKNVGNFKKSAIIFCYNQQSTKSNLRDVAFL